MAQKTIYLFHGDDSYTAYQKANHWRAEFEKKYGDFNVHVLDGSDLSAGGFSEAADTLPFLSEKKLIILKSFLAEAPIEELRKVAEKLENVGDHCIIVFLERNRADSRTALFKNIKKHGQLMEFTGMDTPELAQWITQETTKKGGRIGNRESASLAETVGANLWQMSQEIEKLTLYSKDSAITEENIENLTSPNLSSTVFKLTDHLAQKNRKASLKTLNTLIESGENLIPILFMLVRHIRILLQIKDCLDKKMKSPEIIKKTKEHPFTVNNAMKQSQNFSEEKLGAMYGMLLKMDIATKSGTIKMTTGDNTELRLALEKFIVELCA